MCGVEEKDAKKFEKEREKNREREERQMGVSAVVVSLGFLFSREKS